MRERNPDRQALDSLYTFWQYASALKREPRKGWQKRVEGRVESVADHSFGLALLALYEGERRGQDLEKILKLALIHDLEEAIIGDLTPRDKAERGASRLQRDKERAIRKLLSKIPVKSRPAYLRLWRDLREGRSKEARLVHQLDRVEMAFQAKEYGKLTGQRKMRDFYDSASKEIDDPILKKVLASTIEN
ncbi:MAG TPA: HD domain-containing protein [Candidatus Angelobacter sp.]|nr:HD domain-containing protein [Candidatus Angelobacter sp.]